MNVRSILLLSVMAAAGCASGGKNTAETGREVPLEQRYSLDQVQIRAGELRQGMTKADVYMLLGSPAEYGDRAWVYRGGVDGGKAMRVMFENGRYAGHTTP